VINFTLPAAIPPGMKPGTHRAGGWRGPSICVDTGERENTLPLPQFSPRFTQSVTWSQMSNMSKRGRHRVVPRAHAYWNITLPPTASHTVVFVLQKKKNNKIKLLQIKFVRLLQFHSILILLRHCTPRISALSDHLPVPFTWYNWDSTAQYSIPAPSSTSVRPLMRYPKFNTHQTRHEIIILHILIFMVFYSKY
jgi:hypothetical protein